MVHNARKCGTHLHIPDHVARKFAPPCRSQKCHRRIFPTNKGRVPETHTSANTSSGSSQRCISGRDSRQESWFWWLALPPLTFARAVAIAAPEENIGTTDIWTGLSEQLAIPAPSGPNPAFFFRRSTNDKYNVSSL